MDEDPETVFNPEELIAIGLAEDPKFPPGEGYFYSNTLLLGRLGQLIQRGHLGTASRQVPAGRSAAAGGWQRGPLARARAGRARRGQPAGETKQLALQ
jgi:hypothetical protein